MPTKTYNRVEELINRAGYPDDTVDEADLQATLERANGKVQTSVGRYFTEDKRVRIQTEEDGELVDTYRLKFAPLLELDKILLNQHEQVSESDYTVDRQNGEITFDSDFVDDQLFKGQIIRYRYVPIQFKNLELYYAVMLEKNQELVQLEDSEQTNLYRNAEKLAKQTRNEVNRMAGPGTARDGGRRRGTK